VVDAHGRELEVRGQFVIGLDELREAWSGTLPRLFDAERAVGMGPQAEAAADAAPETEASEAAPETEASEAAPETE
jgi:phosphoribosylformylglycinamidine synthase subunit PurL